MIGGLLLLAVLAAIGNWLQQRGVHRRFRRRQACDNPIHRAEAPQWAAVHAVETWLDSAVFIVVTGIAWWVAGRTESLWGLAGLIAGGLVLCVVGYGLTGAWAMRRERTLGLTKTPCS